MNIMQISIKMLNFAKFTNWFDAFYKGCINDFFFCFGFLGGNKDFNLEEIEIKWFCREG